jgi:hypothetical protein
MKGNYKAGNILIDADLWELDNLKKVCHDLNLPAHLAKMSTFFEPIYLESGEFVA